MPRRVLGLLCVAVVSFVVRDVGARLIGSASEESLVGLDVKRMANRAALCQCCLKSRDKEGRSGRSLHRLPVEVTQWSQFKRKGLPVMLCEFCDGDALHLALTTHDKRVKKPTDNG